MIIEPVHIPVHAVDLVQDQGVHVPVNRVILAMVIIIPNHRNVDRIVMEAAKHRNDLIADQRVVQRLGQEMVQIKNV